MLTLTRKKGESVVLPDLGVTIVVVRASGGQARLAFEAPRDVRILRGELPDNAKFPFDPNHNKEDEPTDHTPSNAEAGSG